MTKNERIAALEKKVADLTERLAAQEKTLLRMMLTPYTAPQLFPKVTPEWANVPSWWSPNTSGALRKQAMAEDMDEETRAL